MYRQLFSKATKSTVSVLTRQSLFLKATAECSSSNVGTEDPPNTEKCVNQVTLLGRVGIHPQLRGSDEHPVTVFSMATHSTYKYQNGEVQRKTEWHRVSIFKPHLRSTVYKYLKKGQRVLIQGKLMYGQITDANGKIQTTSTVVADEVVFFNDGRADQEVIEEEEVS